MKLLVDAGPIFAYLSADDPDGITDASVMAAAERLGTPKIATLDTRHFLAVASERFGHFELF